MTYLTRDIQNFIAMNKNVNIGKHSRFVVFVKRKIARTRPRKYFFLSKDDVIEFLREIHNNIFLLTTHVQSRAINFGRQGHSLTQSKMLHCKTVVNIITYHHVV
jgi:hypothetical protein